MNGPQSTRTETRAQKAKEIVRDLIDRRDLDGFRAWAREARNPGRPLISLLFDPDPLVRWRATEALGVVARIGKGKKARRVREIIRRLLWLMNDESGSLMAHAPEAIAEMLVHAPSLVEEYGPILLSSVGTSPFERGVHWAMARFASVNPAVVADCAGALTEALHDKDPFVRAHALLALQAVDPRAAVEGARRLADDGETFSVYDFASGLMVESSVGEVAESIAASLHMEGGERK